jgi:hypothetical protein
VDDPRVRHPQSHWVHALSRRRFGGFLATLGLGAGPGRATQAHAKKRKKKKKKKCKPACTGGAVCQKRVCVCPSGQKPCQGQCVPSDACCGDGSPSCGCAAGTKPCAAGCIPDDACCTSNDCIEGASCANQICSCPAETVECDGACTPADRVCEEFCCPVDVECFTGGCACEEFLCRCDEELTYCSTPDFTQCCLPEDDCDPDFACTTDTCAAGNDVCSLGAAFCGAGELCLCAITASDEPFCADFQDLEDCPASSECASDEDCNGETCVNVPCCEEDAELFGVCLPACAALRGAWEATTDRARGRRQLARALDRNVPWTLPRQD